MSLARACSFHSLGERDDYEAAIHALCDAAGLAQDDVRRRLYVAKYLYDACGYAAGSEWHGRMFVLVGQNCLGGGQYRLRAKA